MNVDIYALNFPAVAAAALGTFFLGSLWYTVLFGKLWLGLNGYTEEKMKTMQSRRPMPVYFAILLICYLIIALVVALLVTAFRIQTLEAGAILGFLLWLGPAAAVGLTGNVSSDKPVSAFLIDASYQLVYLVFMGALLGAWH